MQKRIAGGLTCVVAIYFLAVLYRLLFDPTPIPTENVNAVVSVLGILVGIYGSVIGFYFGTARRET